MGCARPIPRCGPPRSRPPRSVSRVGARVCACACADREAREGRRREEGVIKCSCLLCTHLHTAYVKRDVRNPTRVVLLLLGVLYCLVFVTIARFLVIEIRRCNLEGTMRATNLFDIVGRELKLISGEIESGVV